MEYSLMRHVLSSCFGATMALYIIPLMSKIAQRWGIIDHPDGVIKVHKEAVPYLGGIAVYVSFVASLLLFYQFQSSVVWLLLGITVLLIVGLVDDLVVLKPHQKALGQIVAITCLLKGGVTMKAEFFSETINFYMSAFWIFLLVNAFNLIDVMDGLSSLVAILAASSFLGVALLSHNYAMSMLLLNFISPLIVFFGYNKPPARIYLGDCGALFIGGFLAVVPFFFSWGSFSIYGYLVPVAILSIPLFEVGLLLLLRSIEGIPFYQGSPHHFSILLQKQQWSKYRILMLVFVIGLILSINSLFFLENILSLATFLAVCISTLLIFFCIILKKYHFNRFFSKKADATL